MLGVRAVIVLDEAAHVGGDALAVVDQLDRALRSAAPESLPDEGVGGAVEVIIEGDVVVDVDADLLPLGILVRLGRKSS